MTSSPHDLSAFDHAGAPWSELTVLVAGLGISGYAAADTLQQCGARVIAVDGADPEANVGLAERVRILRLLDVDVRLGAEHVTTLPSGVDVVVTSPGWRPDQPLLASARDAGIPVWGEVELAWRMRSAEGAAPWLVVTGTNGKTTTVQMLASMLRAAGLRATSAGNVGTPILDAVVHPEPFDVIAVELSSFQLHWQESMRPQASACLNLAPDHLDWHGSYEAYVAAKGKVYTNTEIACVYNVEDPATERLVEGADVQEGCRAVGFTLGTPAPSMLGVVDDVLADRAFVIDRAHHAAELASLDDVRGEAPSLAPHLVANALAAAALARAHGVPPTAVRDGLRAWQPERHRIEHVATVDGVHWVDDSKATNPHAAQASLGAWENIVWVAGGLLKGADVEELVSRAAPRLRACVLIGRDRAQIAEAVRRHAPDVPVIDVDKADDGVMDVVVRAAAEHALPGDTVLLAPAAASMDMFANYEARGEAFKAAVGRYARGE